ncbi:glycine decarboxylase subunit P, partial [Tulasnella sp. 427]
MVTSLTGLDISNASLLDESTAAAEAMVMAFASSGNKKPTFLVDESVSPQTHAVLRTRAKGFGINLLIVDIQSSLEQGDFPSDLCGVLVQYPDVNGRIADYGALADKVHARGALVACATDLLALTMIKPPGEWGADIAFGNSARFGVPLGYGGPHAAFFSVKDKLKRKMPGRLVGRSKDASGKLAYRLALQTREQHIRREKATSNICTSQALLANMAAMYAVYHGSEGLQRIARRVHNSTRALKERLEAMGYTIVNTTFFDTLTVDTSNVGTAEQVHKVAEQHGINFRQIDQTRVGELESDLATVTGFHACSLQPNSGASGEYAGLSVIRAYHESRGEGHRDVCLIPLSAHGTNPASAVMAGMKVVPVKALGDGSLDLEDLNVKAEMYKDRLAAFMITYPSTFGVFENGVQEACRIIHEHGGQVYLDGANLNAQIGLTNPAICGGDVCHLNLHKTFSIPHGGGGPGVGPICVAEHLAPFLPGHPLVKTGGSHAIDAISAAPWGSASILLISWAYIKMLGGSGLAAASKLALLNANYIAERLKGHYTLRYKNVNNRVAHELLIDLGEFDKAADLKVTDFAKRLQDYGFHPPTCSWPIPTAMLIEPTESETLEELDRFCDAMIQIRKEAAEVMSGHQPKTNNVLKNAPHPISTL